MRGRKINSKSKRKQEAPRKNELAFFRSGVDGRTPRYERRRLTLVNVITAVTGNAAAYSVGNNNVTAAFEFSNMALVYQEYRVRAIHTRILPRVRDNIQTAVGVIFPGSIVSGQFAGGAASATYAAIWAEEGAKLHPEWTAADNMATWDVNPNAKLWTVTSGTVVAANQFGIQFMSTDPAPAVWNTFTLFDTFTEFDVEFRTVQ